jgi:hypothetical protein
MNITERDSRHGAAPYIRRFRTLTAPGLLFNADTQLAACAAVPSSERSRCGLATSPDQPPGITLVHTLGGAHGPRPERAMCTQLALREKPGANGFARSLRRGPTRC